MRGPILNMSSGLGASGVDIEYRRNSQGMTLIHLKRSSFFEFTHSLEFTHFSFISVVLFLDIDSISKNQN